MSAASDNTDRIMKDLAAALDDWVPRVSRRLPFYKPLAGRPLLPSECDDSMTSGREDHIRSW